MKASSHFINNRFHFKNNHFYNNSSTDVIIKELENYSNIRSGPNPNKINLGLDSEFNSIHFGIEIDKCLTFLRPEKFLGPINLRKNFFKFQIFHKFLGLKNFKHLLISIPKCKELNSESKSHVFFGSNVWS